MSWKKDTTAQIERLSVYIRELERRLEALHKDLETALTITATRIQNAQDAYSKMADRLVQMAMVQRGDTQSAAAHRSQERMEVQVKDDWDKEEEVEEDEWPPKGYTRVDRF